MEIMNAKPQTTRRQFLSGRAALDALGESVRESTTAPERTDSITGRGTYLLHAERHAMACQFQVFLNAGQYSGGMEAAIGALNLVDSLEDQMTVYRDHSEISRLNQSAHLGPVPVEPRLFELLRFAVELSKETMGAFDIASGALSKMWGFYRRHGRLPSDEEVKGALENVGSGHLHLDSTLRTVRFGRPGVDINLGSIGKGFALDRCAEQMSAAGVYDFLLHGGQSSVFAAGSRLSADTDGKGWLVGVGHPLRPRQRLAEIRLRDRGLATSGSGIQYFHHEGKRFSHILDPRTGRPAEGVLSVTVAAPTAMEADALATAFFVMGSEASLQFCQERPDLAVVFVLAGPRAGGIDIVPHGFDEDSLTVYPATM